MRAPWFPAAAVVFIGGWGVNQFVPISVLYRTREHWAPLPVAAMFSAYLVGLVPALLWGGPAADRHGRRIVRPALLLSAAGSALLALGSQWPVAVYTSRLATGVAAGVILSAGTAWVTDLSAAAGDGRRGPRRATVAAVGGLACGALGAGLMVQWLPWPTATPELVHAGLAVLALLGLRWTPDPAHRGHAPVRPRELCWETARSARFLGVVMPAGPAVFIAATVAYVVLPPLVADRVAGHAPLFSGVTASLTLGVGLVAGPLAARLDRPGSARATHVAMGTVVAGLVAGAVAVHLRSPVLVLGAAAVLGAGYGLALAAGLHEVERMGPAGGHTSAAPLYHGVAHGGMLTPLLLAAIAGAAPYPLLLLTLAGAGLVALAVTAMVARRH